ncbi:MAG: NADH dehydrogenase [Elusimicrobia bacterium RIFOXYD2_FULL_34_15]|nr:MAG: NADH dehydrogenase [Elusimicrobia bacterium RIFOXYD2_FULL_34_15]
MITSLFYILIFPGFLFLSILGLAVEFVDRKLYARMQNRIGPPWFQPLADFIKLLAKETIIPEKAEKLIFKLLPFFALTSVVITFLYIPTWGIQALFSFNGDIIVVLYLLTIPTLTFFLAGWYSKSLFSMIGAIRALTQFFAYEVPLFISILSPALLAGTWSLSKMTEFYNQHPGYWLFNLIGFGVSVIVLLGKLEKVPFDIPEAETEIVAGSFTEYTGMLLAFFRLAIDIETVVCAALLAAVFLPFGLGLSPIAGFFLFIAKVLFIVALLSLLRTVFARLRIDQMVNFCWKYIAPISFLQLLINIILGAVLVK